MIFFFIVVVFIYTYASNSLYVICEYYTRNSLKRELFIFYSSDQYTPLMYK